MTDEEINDMIAELPPMTPQQLWDQRVSWVYGNCSINNPHVTRDMVVKAMIEIHGERPSE